MAEFPQIDSGLAALVFKQGDDLIDAINKMMTFLSTTSHSSTLIPSTNNQLRNSSNPRQQATIHDGRCSKPKRKRDATRFKEKVLLVEAQGNGKVLNEEELEFLADPGVVESPVYNRHLHIIGSNRANCAYGSQPHLQLFYDNNLKQAIGFQNLFYLKKAPQIRLMLYDGSVIAKETNVISIADSEETLMLEEESRSKMFLNKQYPTAFTPITGLLSASSPVEKLRPHRNFPKDQPTELIKQHNMVEKDEYNRLSKRFSELEQHCISLEIAMQLNKEIFQKNNISVNQTEPLFDQLFELNNLKADLQAKDTRIKKLKAQIKRVNETSTTESVKRDLDEIKTINIELEHRVVQIILWYLDSGCSKHMTRDGSQLTNFIHKFLGTVKFGNDQVAKIMDLEVAFRKHTCFVRNLDGVNLISGSRGTNLYSLSIRDMMASSPICLLSKSTKTKPWKKQEQTHNLNLKISIKKNYTSATWIIVPKLCKLNGKKYIHSIVDDYSRFTWVKFLASKDEALDFIIKFQKMDNQLD
ncbi:hypothetical protein Tco_0878036 [Tanacetum coccineum]|uniref:Retrovirus-related Pol polyprotein from transposon TNT 1-94-like beta-barrel domain-containing protein n=1 Tax=Tanacetum coccineum TaxID=301880 RepID=A0ABQ5BWT3_9ASTR